jgi:hypothetical protein
MVTDSQYQDRIALTLAVPYGQIDGFQQNLSDFSRGRITSRPTMRVMARKCIQPFL